MNYFCQWRLRKKRSKAFTRLARMRAFNDILDRLGGFHGGRVFMIDTAGLKVSPPHLIVTERFSLRTLKYGYAVAAACSLHRRKFEITTINETLTYLIF